MTRFSEHEVVLPVVVVTELEAKRHHPELGYFAREALRRLDDLRALAGRLDAPVPVGYPVGGQELGYLPGSENDKMDPVGAGGLRHPRRGPA